MTSYIDFAADHYMRSVLTDELSTDEADNALTALTALTSIHPELYPFNRTFVRPDHQKGSDGATGVRFVVYGAEGMERMIRVPRGDLADLGGLIDEVLAWAGSVEAAA